MAPVRVSQTKPQRARPAPGRSGGKAAEKTKPADKDTKLVEVLDEEEGAPAKAEASGATGAGSARPESAAQDSELGAPPTPSAESGAQKLSPLTPAKSEFPSGPPPAAPLDFESLMGRIAALRSRVQALTATLFKSRLRVSVAASGDARIESLRVTLDDGVVFAAPERFAIDDERVVYEHPVAPGQHVLGIDVERYAAGNKQYRTWQTSRFAVVVPEGQALEAELVIEDDSDMAEEFPDDAEGEYDLRVRLKARALGR